MTLFRMYLAGIHHNHNSQRTHALVGGELRYAVINPRASVRPIMEVPSYGNLINLQQAFLHILGS